MPQCPNAPMPHCPNTPMLQPYAEAACRAHAAPRPLVPVGAARGHVLEHVATLARPRAARAAPPVALPGRHLHRELKLLAVRPVARPRHGQRAAARARRALRARRACATAVARPRASPRSWRADAMGNGGGGGVERPRA
eukprot:scaffold57835_cov63-Phaeocystis_antarctica.AAC.4